MKKNLQSIPVPLQHQLLIQMSLAVLCAVLAVVVWIIFSGITAVPFFCGTLLLAISVFRLYHIASTETYLALKGTVLKVERTPFRQKARALMLEVEGKALRVMLRNRHLTIQSGDRILLYISDTAPLYEWRGVHQLHSYLTLTREKQGSSG